MIAWMSFEEESAVGWKAVGWVGPEPGFPRLLCHNCGTQIYVGSALGGDRGPFHLGTGNMHCDNGAHERIQARTKGMPYAEAKEYWEAEPMARLTDEQEREWKKALCARDEWQSRVATIKRRIGDLLYAAERTAWNDWSAKHPLSEFNYSPMRRQTRFRREVLPGVREQALAAVTKEQVA